MMLLILLLYPTLAAVAFAISAMALLFWWTHRRTRLVLAQAIYFACEFLRFAILTYSVGGDDSKRVPLIVASVILLVAMVYYALQYHRRLTDY